MKISVKKLNQKAVVPQYAKLGDAGLDLTATSYEWKDDRHVYGTGLAIEIPKGYVGLLFPRSSICKHDLRLANSVGVIDSGYRGEIKFMFENDSMAGRETVIAEDFKIDNVILTGGPVQRPKIYQVGDRIGQLIILSYRQIECEEVQELSDSSRGDSGFGSSGK